MKGHCQFPGCYRPIQIFEVCCEGHTKYLLWKMSQRAVPSVPRLIRGAALHCAMRMEIQRMRGEN